DSNPDSNGPSNNNPSNTPDESNVASTLTDNIRQQIESVISPHYDSSVLMLDWDSTEVQDDYYVIPAYYRDNNNYAGKFYIPKNDFSGWRYVASDLTVYGQETPLPDSPNLGEADTSE
ncbi:hypothetical protein, partial [Methanosphaera sp.]